jgi:hypothetical protein
VHIGGEAFGIDLYALPLGEYDMVLGVQWLGTLGPILWDLARHTMVFQRGAKRVLWHGVDTTPGPAAMALSASGGDLMDALLEEFAGLFEAPQGLPPRRHLRHRIRLKPGTAALAVRPYRYAHAQKDELARQCDEMLRLSVIRPSSSAFSSPALLIRKHDDSWRFRVYYRALNDATIKDKFPMPVVEELLDELRGAKFFTKLDMRSGYHQVLMHPDDVEKTAFHTHQGLFEFLVMPFGLTNAPATFQALMSDILLPFLRRFVLVFFDDILIYSSSWSDHLRHVRTVFRTLQDHQLRLKQSKCAFGQPSVAYLGRVISAEGVAMDKQKVQAVLDWPIPRSARAVRGFLGLAGYYRRFIKDFGTIAAPLTALLRKEGFSWNTEAARAFQKLQCALTTAPVLQLPDFDRDFIVECDALGSGFGAVLHQGAGPIAFFSKPIAPRHAKLAAYERELIGLVQAVRHWRPYLWGRHFVVRTDHRSLRFILDQRLSTIPQHQWASKLLGFDFAVEYKPGALNVVADALSRRDEGLAAAMALSAPQFSLFEEVRQEINGSVHLSALRDAIRGGAKPAAWSVVDGLILFNGRVFIDSSSSLGPMILELVHGTGHEGVHKTLHRLRTDFHFPNDRVAVQDYVRACIVCQQNKTDHLQPGGFLQPLEVPSSVWSDVAMDFVEALPKVNGKSVILTVVDRFSKAAHFIPLAHPYTAKSVAKAFFAEVVRLHGIPSSVVSDRDPVFTSTFWRELFKMAGVKLQFTSAFHPQSDGQSEATNKIIAMYLRCLTGDRLRNWLEWLPWAEFCYNSSYQQSLKTSPFQVVFGRPPPSIRSYETGDARLPAVDKAMQERDEFLAEVRDRLEQAQQHYKAVYDRRHHPVEFVPGQWVWLRLLHRAAASLQVHGRSKLGPKFFGPYQVAERIGAVAYRLLLTAGARIHDVFHVGLLKPFHGVPPSQPPVLPPVQHGRVLVDPDKVLKGRLARGRRQILVRWKGAPASETAWVDLEEFQAQYPEYQLEDELLVQAGRDVMYGLQFGRRARRPTGPDGQD